MKDIPEFVNCVQIDRTSNKKQSHLPHVHEDFMELFYVCSGDGKYMVNNRLYDVHEGDIVICDAGVIHGEEPELVSKIQSYSVAMKAVQEENLPPNCLIEENDNPVVSCGRLSGMVEEIMHLLFISSGDYARFKELCGYLTGAMYSLTQTMLAERGKASTGVWSSEESPAALARRARHFLNKHYSEPLTLHTLASRLYVSEYYLAHVFSEEYKISPMKYVTKRRIGEAQDLLMHKDTSITDIAFMLGYGSVSHFNTMFKKYVGMSPGDYRRSFQREDAK